MGDVPGRHRHQEHQVDPTLSRLGRASKTLPRTMPREASSTTPLSPNFSSYSASFLRRLFLWNVFVVLPLRKYLTFNVSSASNCFQVVTLRWSTRWDRCSSPEECNCGEGHHYFSPSQKVAPKFEFLQVAEVSLFIFLVESALFSNAEKTLK